MSWTKTTLESCNDKADPGWTETTMEACADSYSTFAFAGDDPSHADTGTRATSAGWTAVSMESVCD